MKIAQILRRAPILFVLLVALVSLSAHAAPIRVITAPKATPREQYAAQRLRQAVQGIVAPVPNAKILLAVESSPVLKSYNLPQLWPGSSEAFLLRRVGHTWIVAGSDPSGVLYGSLELASRITAAKGLPAELDFEDHPALKLRGVCIGMQKSTITYEGAEYDYPYTPQNFPFFYNRAEWIRYLNFLVNNRYNTLYLWNGHPFTSLLKLPRYPEAQELPTAQLNQNIAMFNWLTHEADKRGIWIVQGFYNIHLSHAFARAHGLPYHLKHPNPLASQYTQYAIAQFIKNYPNVGLLVTLGEALSPHDGAQWLSQTIIPGVKQGLRELGTTTEPPLVVRAHATNIDQVLAESLPLYHNIDVMEKWTGESLVGFNVRGTIRAEDAKLSDEAPADIANIHILANLEPFRWGNPDYIRKCVLNFQKIGIKGLHLYPLRFWTWPYTADNTTPRLMQIDRDWIWFQAWGRYAWNPNRDPAAEHAYWVQKIGERYGSSIAGEKLLTAYESSGICAPELLPWIGITEGNRESFSLGLTMPQLIDAELYGPAKTLWTGDAPKGERLPEFVVREVAHQPHQGITPLSIAMEMSVSSQSAVRAAEEAGQYVSKNRAEYQRLLNDTRSIHALMQFYNAKTQAAYLVLLYGYDHNLAHLQEAEGLLSQSVDDYRQLVALTNTTYLAAPSLDSAQRRVPFLGGPGLNTHWRDCLPKYEEELAIFRSRLAWLQQACTPSKACHPERSVAESRDLLLNSAAEHSVTFGTDSGDNGFVSGHGFSRAVKASNNEGALAPEASLPQIPFTLNAPDGQTFTVAPGTSIYKVNGNDQNEGIDTPIAQLAPSLDDLKGIRIAFNKIHGNEVNLALGNNSRPAKATGVHLTVTLTQPARVLVGFFFSASEHHPPARPIGPGWTLESINAVTAKGSPSLTVWSRVLPAGTDTINPGPGAYVVLGFTSPDSHVRPKISFYPSPQMDGQPGRPDLDWLFVGPVTVPSA